jgi:hypothetical protein
MSELKRLYEARRNAKNQMNIHKHTIGFLGSKYYYWESVYKSIKQKITNLK